MKIAALTPLFAGVNYGPDWKGTITSMAGYCRWLDEPLLYTKRFAFRMESANVSPVQDRATDNPNAEFDLHLNNADARAISTEET